MKIYPNKNMINSKSIINWNFVIILIGTYINSFSVFAQNSVLEKGDFYKLAIPNPQGNVYKIDKNFLSQLGINPQNINPQNIKIYGNGGGMLPQPNQITRPNDLVENAIFVKGETDGKFDDSDFILFYAAGSDKLLYNKDLQFIQHEKNLYDEQNYYFLTIGTTAGKRITNVPTITETAQIIDSFEDVDYFEQEVENIAASGRRWFGETLLSGNTQKFSLKNITNLTNDSQLKLIAQTFAASKKNTTTLEILLNSKKLTSISIEAMGTTVSKYLPKGNIAPIIPTLFSFSAKDFINNDGALNFSLKYDSGNESDTYANFDYLTINVQRNLQLYGSNTRFRSLKSLLSPINEYKIANVTDFLNTQVWDITDSYSAFSYNLINSANIASFKAKSTNLREYVVVQTNTDFATPKFVGKIANQNLHGATTPDFVIISHSSVLEAAQKLADFRRKNDKLEVLVVTIDQVYNEFSSGRKDVSAVRDFARFLYKKDKKLKYLLLFGNAFHNYKNEKDYIPTYESYESIHPIFSYASDDYFGILGDNEGEWSEINANNDDLDIGVGRIPIRIADNLQVKTEANGIVDKIIAYTKGAAMGAWRNQVCFVADNDDSVPATGLFQADSENLSQQLNSKVPYLLTDKLYIDAFSTTLTANGNISPIIRKKLNEEVETGSLFINFIGHGSESGWTTEKILDASNIISWSGLNNMPLLMTATCEFGRYDGVVQAGAETALMNSKGGAIALLTTTRPVFSNNNYDVNQAFINNVFKPMPDGTMPRLGDLFRNVKNNSITGAANRNFVLLGDPSLRLAYPQMQTTITKIEVDGKVSTQFSALSKVTISGEIQDKGVLQNNFNGMVYISVLDKAYNATTLGLLDVKMNYVLQDNLLYKGEASVINGKFTVNFVVPKNIDYKDGTGKIVMYAKNNELTVDATGANRAIRVGGSSNNAPIDNTPPSLTMYMDNRNFVSGSKVNKNTTLFVELSDASGLNVSASGIGQDIVVILNDTLKYVVTNYYTTAKDDFTKGNIVFPLKNLRSGKYKLIFRAWDNYNNAVESSLEFYVDYEPFTITTTAYPNPFSDKTTILFSHNRNSDIPISWNYEIYNTLGQVIINSNAQTVQTSPGVFELTWENANKDSALASGLYFYRITIKQLIKNGETATVVGKLFFIP